MKKLPLFVLFAIIISAIGCGGTKANLPPPGTCLQRTIKIAVLPFKNKSGDKANDWFGHASSEAVANSMRNVCGITIVDTKYTASYQNKIGLIRNEQELEDGFDNLKALGAEAIVVGEYELTENQVKIKTRVIEANSGMAMQTITQENHVVQISNLLRNLTADIIKSVNTTILLPKNRRVNVKYKLVAPEVKSFGSFEHYGKCSYALHNYEIEKALGECSKAANLDPTFWQAKIMLSLAYIENGQPMKTKRWLADGAAGARKSGDAYTRGLSYRITSHLSFHVRKIKENTDLLNKTISIYRFTGFDLPLAEALIDLADHYGRVAFLDQVDKLLKNEWVPISRKALDEARAILDKNTDYLLEAKYFLAETHFNKAEAENYLRKAADAAKKGVELGARSGVGPVALCKYNLMLAEMLIEKGDKASASAFIDEADKAQIEYNIKKTATFDPAGKINYLRPKTQ